MSGRAAAGAPLQPAAAPCVTGKVRSVRWIADPAGVLIQILRRLTGHEYAVR